MQNCKRFLDDFAASQGFDPLLPQNWYPISTNQVLKSKVSTRQNISITSTLIYIDLSFFLFVLTYIQGGFGIIEQFKGSLVDALQKVYPNVVFNTNLFKHATRTNSMPFCSSHFLSLLLFIAFDLSDLLLISQKSKESKPS